MFDSAMKTLAAVEGDLMAAREDSADQSSLRFDFDSMFIMPVQRMPRYALLVRELVKNTDAGHPDAAALKATDETIRKVTTFVNKRKAAAENLTRLMSLQRQLVGLPFQLVLSDAFEADKLLEKYGTLNKRESVSLATANVVTQRKFILQVRVPCLISGVCFVH